MAKKRDERAERLQDCLSVIHGAQSRERADIMAIGEALSSARGLLEGDETFTKWVESECDFSRTTAYRYIDAWDAFRGKPRELVELFTASAIYALSKEKSPDEAIERAIAYASKKRHRVTKALAEGFIAAAVPSRKGDEKARPAPHVGREPITPASSSGTKGTAFDPDTAKRPDTRPAAEPEPDDDPAEESYFAARQYEPETADSSASEHLDRFALFQRSMREPKEVLDSIIIEHGGSTETDFALKCINDARRAIAGLAERIENREAVA